ncbi:MAG: hypothetical protein DHS20C15_01910 [Planctomycetota bacterium]|nr:MAG: hypothetical protein DHS20C15_01910 [Planctomycetota bacterium]
MITMLLSLLLFVPADEDLPGTAFAHAREETVLHAGPGGQHAGVLTLPSGALVRIEDIDAAYDRVFVPQGFPVYVHADFAQVDQATQTARITGENINVRVLPAVSGVRAVASLSASDGALQLLDVEGGWVRVMAPAAVPLYAPSDAFTPVSDATARSAWKLAFGKRAAKQSQRLAFYRATDPTWLRRQQNQERVAALEAKPVATLSEAELTALGRSATELAAELEDAALRARAESVQRAVDDAFVGRSAALQAREALAREQAREMAAVAREARYLDFGLRFLGKGEAHRVEGEITRRTSDSADVAVYSLQDRVTGERFKLSLSKEIGKLPPLLGKRVVLEGRQVPIVNVSGPVLVIDKVVRVIE